MSDIGQKLVNATDKIPPQDKQAFINGLNAISDRLGVCRDWLYIIMMTETGVRGKIDPSAYNGNCGGLIQFCRGSGASTVGKSPEEIRNMSAVQQLPLIEKYLSSVGVVRGGDLPTTYLSVLFPAHKNKPRNVQLAIPKQSNHLYQGGKLTKETLEKGLLTKAGTSLGPGPGGCNGTPSAGGSPPTTSVATAPGPVLPGQIGTPGGQLSDFMIGECQPWDYTVASAKVFTGCEVFGVNSGVASGGTTTAPTGGAPPTGGETPPSTGVNVPPPGEGTWMNPAPQLILTSRFGPRSAPGGAGSRNHEGIDLGGQIRSPILASRSGVVVGVSQGCPPQGGYPGNPCGGKGGNWIRIFHDGDWQTRYLHLWDVLVKMDQVVKQGDKIGTMGHSGSSTGPHLHFEIRQGGGRTGRGGARDPLALITPKPGAR